MRIASDVNSSVYTYVKCQVPGSETGIGVAFVEGLNSEEQLELTSAINHPGGDITLECQESNIGAPQAYVDSATLLITQVASVG